MNRRGFFKLISFGLPVVMLPQKRDSSPLFYFKDKGIDSPRDFSPLKFSKWAYSTSNKDYKGFPTVIDNIKIYSGSCHIVIPNLEGFED